jgi:hypothetical protein
MDRYQKQQYQEVWRRWACGHTGGPIYRLISNAKQQYANLQEHRVEQNVPGLCAMCQLKSDTAKMLDRPVLYTPVARKSDSPVNKKTSDRLADKTMVVDKRDGLLHEGHEKAQGRKIDRWSFEILVIAIGYVASKGKTNLCTRIEQFILCYDWLSLTGDMTAIAALLLYIEKFNC